MRFSDMKYFSMKYSGMRFSDIKFSEEGAAGRLNQIYDWVRNLTGYFLFMAVLENLLPGKKYARFVKFFAGIVLILLVLQPLAGSRQLEEVAARYYEAFVFQDQADDLKKEILGVEHQRLEQIFRQYEQAIETDVSLMAEDMGFGVEECRASISGAEGSEQFGTVTRIALKVYWEENDGSGRIDGAAMQQEEGDVSEEIRIAPGDVGSEAAEASQGTAEASQGTAEADSEAVEAGHVTAEAGHEAEFTGSEVSRQVLRRQQEEVREAAGKLRRKIGAYYNLEDNYVEIQIVEGER